MNEVMQGPNPLGLLAMGRTPSGMVNVMRVDEDGYAVLSENCIDQIARKVCDLLQERFELGEKP